MYTQEDRPLEINPAAYQIMAYGLLLFSSFGFIDVFCPSIDVHRIYYVSPSPLLVAHDITIGGCEQVGFPGAGQLGFIMYWKHDDDLSLVLVELEFDCHEYHLLSIKS